MVLWVVGSIPHGGPIELFLVPASASLLWYVLSCLWDDAYKRSLAANRKVAYVAAADFLFCYLKGKFTIRHITVNKNVLSVSLDKIFPSSFIYGLQWQQRWRLYFCFAFLPSVWSMCHWVQQGCTVLGSAYSEYSQSTVYAGHPSETLLPVSYRNFLNILMTYACCQNVENNVKPFLY